MSEKTFKFPLDQKLPPLPFLLYGMQWFVVNVTSIIILGAVVAQMQLGLPDARIVYMQKLFAITGFALLYQTLWGHRLPVVMGPAAVLLVGMVSAGADGVSAVYTSVICGGALLYALSFTPFLNKIQVLFTGRIVAVVLALICFTLMPTIIHLLFAPAVSQGSLFYFNLVFFVVLMIANRLLKGLWKSMLLIFALIVGTIAFKMCFPSVTAEQVSLPSWSLLQKNLFLPSFDFNIGIMLSFFFCYLALFINEVGSLQAVQQTLNTENNDQRSKLGVRFTGLFNVVCGLFGVIGPVDYSMSPGIIQSTGCASRYALIPAAIAIMACAAFPSVQAVLGGLPAPIMGGLLLYLMGTQLASSFSLIGTKHLVTDFYSCLTLAFPILLSVFIAFLPAEAIASIPALIRPILGNGFVMGVIAVILLEHTRSKKEEE